MKEENFDLIDRYFDSELNALELETFNHRLKTDAAFANQVQLIKEVEIANSIDSDKFKSIVSEVGGKYKSSQPQIEKKMVSIWSRRLVMAASILALAVSGFLLWFTFSKTLSPEQLYAEHFEAYPNNITVRNNSDLDRLSEAMSFYDVQNYQKAIQVFQTIKQDSASDTVLFYEGMSLLSTDQTTRAIQNFKTLSQDKNSIYQIQSFWYLALAHLKNGDQSNAKRILGQISENPKSEVYARKAKELLKKLE